MVLVTQGGRQTWGPALGRAASSTSRNLRGAAQHPRPQPPRSFSRAAWAKLLGHVGHIGRFPSQDHFAGYTATASLDASSGNQQRHQLNAAPHTIAVCRARDPGPSRSAPTPISRRLIEEPF
jgi:Transposase IS116/IS110/IS902 family